MARIDASGNGWKEDVQRKTPVYKIEVPANRYDLLCLEGIAQALKCYIGNAKMPDYKLIKPAQMQKIIVKKETAEVRPYVTSCILRNIKFDVQSYNSFIDLQDKLHNNICRKRAMCSMGTHDLSKIAPGPITYEAHPPQDIVF
jgi:phenylalanyl-tRNA synthetase beta chain